MKKLIVTLGLCLFSVMSLSAQDNLQKDSKTEQTQPPIMYKDGYRGNVELSWGAFQLFEFSTSHGYSLGNGLYMGVGAGFAAEFADGFDQAPVYTTPLFVEAKQNLLRHNLSPFWGVRVGGIADISNEGVRLFANPYIGLDISRFSIKAGYDFHLEVFGEGSEKLRHFLKVSLGISF